MRTTKPCFGTSATGSIQARSSPASAIPEGWMKAGSISNSGATAIRSIRRGGWPMGPDRMRGPMPVFARIVLIVTCLGGGVARAEPPRVAIVIDDVGFQWQLDQRAMALDPPVALAIIPEGPLAGYLARKAAQQNREVWVHLPMAGLHNDN